MVSGSFHEALNTNRRQSPPITPGLVRDKSATTWRGGGGDDSMPLMRVLIPVMSDRKLDEMNCLFEGYDYSICIYWRIFLLQRNPNESVLFNAGYPSCLF